MKEITIDNSKYYVGQNITENDKLYKEMPLNAEWFHLDSDSSAHVYCICDKLTKKEIKQASILVRKFSKGQGQVIHIKKNKIKRVGPGLIEVCDVPKKS